MTNIPSLLTASMAGCILGGIFFGALWWTVRKGASSQQPALWFLVSMLARMTVALAGFILLAPAIGSGWWHAFWDFWERVWP